MHDRTSVEWICNCSASVIGHKYKTVGIPPRDTTGHDQGQSR